MTPKYSESERVAQASIRRATLDDALPVCLLLHRLGLATSPTDLESARRLWTRYWVDNPACRVAGTEFPIGWIMEHEGQPVGYFGNIPIIYRMGGRDLLAGVATSWGVEKPFRSRTSDLAREYFTQPNVDLVLITTAILPAGRVCLRFGADPLPQNDYDEVLFWILNSAAFLAAAFRKRNLYPRLVAPLAYCSAPGLAASIALQRRTPGTDHHGLRADIIGLDAVDEQFTTIWNAKADDGRLFAYRRSLDLKWHFASPSEHGGPAIIRCSRGSELKGYLVLIRERAGSLGLVRAKVLDLFVLEDDTEVIDVLFSAAHTFAVSQKCHVLEVIGLSQKIRAHLRTYRPFTRRFPAFPFFFKAMSPDLAVDLASANRWYPTLYDGDGSL